MQNIANIISIQSRNQGGSIPSTFAAFLTSDLTATKGGPLTYTRASTVRVPDGSTPPVLQTVGNNVPAFGGLRCVTNNIKGSANNLAATGWLATGGGSGVAAVVTPNYIAAPSGILASRVQLDKGAGTASTDFSEVHNTCVVSQGLSLWAKTNNGATVQVVVRPVSGAYTVITITPEWKLFSVIDNASAGYLYIGLWGAKGTSDTADISVYGVMAEVTTGRVNKSPSELVPAVTSQWFASLNSNLGITTYGDSLTGTGVPTTYPQFLQQLNTGQAITNKGVGGFKSSDMLTAMQLGGVYLQDTLILWIGVNDISFDVPTQTTKDNILAAVALIPHNRWMIFGTLNWDYISWPLGSSRYNQVIALNSWMATAFGDHYFDMRAYLVSLYNPSIPQDVIYHDNDSVPWSFKSDSIHLNDMGYFTVAQKAHDLLESNNLNILPYTPLVSQGVLVEGTATNIFANPLAPATQSITVTAVQHVLSFYGTGTITISGVSSGALVGTGANNRVEVAFTPTAGSLTLTLSGTVTAPQLEISPMGVATSAALSSGATTTRAAVVISEPSTDINYVGTKRISLDWTPTGYATGTDQYIWGTYVDASNYTAMIFTPPTSLIMRKRIAGSNNDATLTITAPTLGTTLHVDGYIMADNTLKIGATGYTSATNSNTTAAQVGATIQLGANGNGVNQIQGFLKNYKILGR